MTSRPSRTTGEDDVTGEAPVAVEAPAAVELPSSAIQAERKRTSGRSRSRTKGEKPKMTESGRLLDDSSVGLREGEEAARAEGEVATPGERARQLLQSTSSVSLLPSDLFDALSAQDEDKLERLRNLGMNFDAEEPNSGYSVLHWVVMNRLSRALRYMVAARPTMDCDATDANGWTALHYAARNGDFSTTNQLLDLGCSPLVVNSKKQKPSALAKKKEVQKLLKAAEKAAKKKPAPRIPEERTPSPVVGYASSAGVDVDARERDRKLFAKERRLEEEALRLEQLQINLENRDKKVAEAETALAELREELAEREARVKAAEQRMRESMINSLPRITPDDLDILEKVGEGGFGQVSHAVWEATDVAAKQLPCEEADESDRLAFESEVAVLATMRHPHIVPLLAVCCDAPVRMMIMPLYERSLADAVRKTSTAPLDPRGLLRVSMQLALALAYMHSRRPALIHRDIKPANVLLSASGDAVLTDLGLVRSADMTVERDSTLNFAGSIRYMAPECLRKESYGTAADVYSFGATVWEMFVGEVPWHEFKVSEVEAKVGFSDERLPPLRDVSSVPVPPVLSGMIEACTGEQSRRPKMHKVAASLKKLYSTL